ncbi:hypothetical protein HETIRDRAFT_450355 [Heterobasidion irregulare TC 32-1]|uniref:Integrase catalytic domain-containing protein n=1 Tax=Heterobasidion irregulare (strain TC 32-1) TaxID=747525 RepID=W4K9P8_HETIT|nr:uncharacterized protein HETIRDRAFT_450355 [Heterobasidion irregulare TC 32-1]ETW82508.1 hypothetical protein HETIRDRAFT_450355 [Heterobasidion irregulare TC 32-1]
MSHGDSSQPKSKIFDSINVVVDQGLSKGIVITPCKKTITAEEMPVLFQNNVFNRHGLPTKIVSDRGPQFMAKFTWELWKWLAITAALSMVYHPQTDGEMEWDNWVDLLLFAEFSHNTWKHSATGKSPFEVLYSFNPPYLADIALETKEEAAASLQMASNYAKDWDFNRKLPHWEEGNQVWLEGTHIWTMYPKFKLAPRRYSPFKILAKIEELAYKLQIPPH